MPENQSEEITQQKINEELGGYIHRTDLRLVALQQVLSIYFKFSDKQREKFDAIVENHYKILLQKSAENAEDKNPALAARLIDGQNLYSCGE